MSSSSKHESNLTLEIENENSDSDMIDLLIPDGHEDDPENNQIWTNAQCEALIKETSLHKDMKVIDNILL